MQIYKQGPNGVEEMRVLPHAWPVYERRGWSKDKPEAKPKRASKAAATETNEVADHGEVTGQ